MFKTIHTYCFFLSETDGVVNLCADSNIHGSRFFPDVKSVETVNQHMLSVTMEKVKDNDTQCDDRIQSYHDRNKRVYYHGDKKFITNPNEFSLKDVVTGEMFGSDHFACLNDIPIKKYCTVGAKYKDGIITDDGELYLIHNFDSDNVYNLGKVRVPALDETFVDIDCSGMYMFALTESGKVFKIDNRAGHYQHPIEIENNVKAISYCGNTLVLLTNNNQIFYQGMATFWESILIETSDLCTEIVDIQCTSHHVYIKTVDDKLYKSICHKNSSPEFISDITNLSSRFHKTKSAKCAFD